MAKPASGDYQPDKRVMFKVKHERDCDCVVAGFRWYKDAENWIASLSSNPDTEAALAMQRAKRKFFQRVQPKRSA